MKFFLGTSEDEQRGIGSGDDSDDEEEGPSNLT